MTKKLKKPVSILLSLIMVFSLFTIVPISASAETITTVTNSHDISINSDTTITGTASNTKITVTGDCTIILDGLNLTNTSNRGKCGIDIQSGTVNLIIKGENKITAGGQNGDACPIGVRENATLIISGYNNENDGNILTVIGTTNGKAAIGGAWDQWTCGTIVINSGTINATGGGYGASVIGKGGNRNTTKSVTINGGVITTTLKDTLQGATAIGGGNMSVSYSPSYDTPLIMNGVTVYPTVTWMNYDGTELKKDEIVAEGITPSYDGATPEKAEDDDYTYTFSGWTDGTTNYGLTDTLPVVTGNVTYTATYTANEKPVITWNNWDGTTFKSDHVNVGAVPTYDGETPTKDGVTFAGWTDSHGVFYAKDATLPEVTADETYTAVFELTIGSVDEWNSFAASVKGGNTYSGMIVRMTADVGPVTTMVDGTFSGTFDGDGHTLTVNISGGSTSAATFAYVKDATIQNLRLEGTVTSSGIHTAALVKSVSDTGSTCTIKNVDIYADVNCSQGYIGGFIGHAGVANTVNIENSIFAGSINKTGSTQGFIGAFIGWSQKLTATINNCAFTGSYNNINSFNNIGFSYNAPTKVTVSGFYSNASEVFVANVNHGTRLYVPSSSYPTTVALVKNNDGETFYSAFSDALAAWTDGSTLALLADVTCDSMISVPANTSKILDLNGKTLTTVATNTVYGTLTIQSTVSGGNIIHTNKSQVISVKEEATLNINSGTIHGYNADRAVIGGAEGGTYNLNGGKIVTSASNAFSIGSGSTLNLNGGEIECTSGSTSMGTASAVWSHGDSTINWNGTAITTNTGDGIRMKSAGNGTVNVTGGSFTATSSSLPEEGGYAVYVNSNMSSLNLKGNPSFSGRGIYLTNDKVINITNELSNTNPISVTMQTPGVFTSGLSGNGDASNFANGNGTGYAITLNASGEAQMVPTYTVTWKNGDTVLETDADVAAGSPAAYNGETPTKADAVCCTFTFAGWNDGTTTYAPDAVPAVNGDVTYTAVFTDAPKTGYYKATAGGHSVYSIVPFGENIDGGETYPEFFFDNETEVFRLTSLKNCKYYYYDENGTEITASSTGGASGNYNVMTTSDPMPTIVLVKPVYRIQWNNWDNTPLSVLGTDVIHGETPVYEGETPTKDTGDGKTYAFTGWTPELAPATDNATYTATFEEVEEPQKLIAGHTLSLEGNIAINFYLDPSAAGLTADQVTADNFSYSLEWVDKANTKAKVDVAKQAAGQAFSKEGSYIKVTCHVCAAEMSCDINASFTMGEKTESETYSIRKYGDSVYNATTEQIDSIFGGQTEYNKLVGLMNKMLDYGSNAQTVFGVKTYDLADSGLGLETQEVTSDMFTAAIQAANGRQADDISAKAAELGASFKSPSLVFLDYSTIKLYFAKENDSFNTAGLTKWNDYYYAQVRDIPAAKLDTLQEFEVSGTKLYYSALDYAKALAGTSNTDYVKLAWALYGYNQAANAYFDAAPAQNIVNLSTVTEDTTVEDGYTITGTLGGNFKISIADGAKVTIQDVNITKLGTGCNWAGINCPGDATLVLEGENTVCAGLGGDGNNHYPGIWIAPDKTLTIEGDGSLTAYSGNAPYGAGIGGGYKIAAGNIVINGGIITATGGNLAAGIGSGPNDSCGDITINGGTVTATCTGQRAAGIGSGSQGNCGNITINGGTVTASGSKWGAGIGSGASKSSCGNITISAKVTSVTATKGSGAPNSIGAGAYNSTCGTVTIEDGANVTQN